MLHKLILVFAAITVSYQSSMGQEVMQAYAYNGVPVVETSGRVFSLNENLVLVGRSGVWKRDSAGQSWVQLFRPKTGTVIVVSTEGINGTILFLASDRKVWRVQRSGAVDLLPVAVPEGDSHLLCETSFGLFVVRENRVLGTIDADVFAGSEQIVIPTLSPPVKYATPRALMSNVRCDQQFLTVSGNALDSSLGTRYLTYEVSPTGWKLVGNSTTQQAAAVVGGGTVILANDGLFHTTACPPIASGSPILRVDSCTAITALTDTTVALFQRSGVGDSRVPVYIVNTRIQRIVDSIVLQTTDVVEEVLSHRDMVVVQCRDRIYGYADGLQILNFAWPLGEASATFTRATGTATSATLYGSGLIPPSTLTFSKNQWQTLFEVGGDTSQIHVVSGACQAAGVTYLWEAERLYVSAGQDPERRFFRSVRAPRRIQHVQPITEDEVLVLVEIDYRDTVSVCWYAYSRTSNTLTGIRDNWPRDVNILSASESVHDKSSDLVIVGTRSFWYKGRTDTNLYHMYGVLQRPLRDSIWTPVNTGLDLSIRCFGLQQDKHGTLFMLAGYSDGTLTYPRPSLYTSTDMGASWVRSRVAPPSELGRNLKLSVTSNGVFLHDIVCYRVLDSGDEYVDVKFSVGPVGAIHAIMNGPDSTSVTLVTATGVYNATATTTQVEEAPDERGSARLSGNTVIITSASLGSVHGVSIINTLGETVFSGDALRISENTLQLSLPSYVSPGLYFVIVNNRVYTLLM